MANYESEHTQFMREWLQQHPEELQVQKSGRALWWDKGPQDPAEAQRLTEAEVPQKAYYYDAN